MQKLNFCKFLWDKNTKITIAEISCCTVSVNRPLWERNGRVNFTHWEMRPGWSWRYGLLSMTVLRHCKTELHTDIGTVCERIQNYIREHPQRDVAICPFIGNTAQASQGLLPTVGCLGHWWSKGELKCFEPGVLFIFHVPNLVYWLAYHLWHPLICFSRWKTHCIGLYLSRNTRTMASEIINNCGWSLMVLSWGLAAV